MSTISPFSTAPIRLTAQRATQGSALRFQGSSTNTVDSFQEAKQAAIFNIFKADQANWNKCIIMIGSKEISHKKIFEFLYKHYVTEDSKTKMLISASAVARYVYGGIETPENIRQLTEALAWLDEKKCLSINCTTENRILYNFSDAGIQLARILFPNKDLIKGSSQSAALTIAPEKLAKIERIKLLMLAASPSTTTGWDILKTLQTSSQKQPEGFLRKLVHQYWYRGVSGVATETLHYNIVDLNLTRERLNNQLNQLAQMGWIQQTPHTQETRWKLTEEGKKLLQNATPFKALNIQKADLQVLLQQELQRLATEREHHTKHVTRTKDNWHKAQKLIQEKEQELNTSKAEAIQYYQENAQSEGLGPLILHIETLEAMLSGNKQLLQTYQLDYIKAQMTLSNWEIAAQIQTRTLEQKLNDLPETVTSDQISDLFAEALTPTLPDNPFQLPQATIAGLLPAAPDDSEHTNRLEQTIQRYQTELEKRNQSLA